MYECKLVVAPTKSLKLFGGYRSIGQDATVASFTLIDTAGTNFEGPFGGVAYEFTENVKGTFLVAAPRLIDVPFDDQRQVFISAGVEAGF